MGNTEARFEQDSWQLKVQKNGHAELIDMGSSSSILDDDFVCNEKNVFSVTKGLHYGGREGGWENSVSKVKLILNSCSEVEKVKTCDIKIEQSVGLTWHPSFKPKAIFK